MKTAHGLILSLLAKRFDISFSSIPRTPVNLSRLVLTFLHFGMKITCIHLFLDNLSNITRNDASKTVKTHTFAA